MSLRSCDFDGGGIEKLCRGLRINSTLRNLDLSDNALDDGAATDIAAAFSYGEMQLTQLNLAENMVGDSGARELAHRIRHL